MVDVTGRKTQTNAVERIIRTHTADPAGIRTSRPTSPASPTVPRFSHYISECRGAGETQNPCNLGINHHTKCTLNLAQRYLEQWRVPKVRVK